MGGEMFVNIEIDPNISSVLEKTIERSKQTSTGGSICNSSSVNTTKNAEVVDRPRAPLEYP
jgi:hypothetical protein